MVVDDYIREVDEYSEETHSEEDFGGRGRGRRHDKSSTSVKSDTVDDAKKPLLNSTIGGENSNMEELQRNIQKRINQILYSRVNLGAENAEKLIEKI